MSQTPAYKRILLKLSGEALMGDDSYGINRATIGQIVDQIKEISELGSRSGLSSVAGISSAGSRRLPPAWTVRRRTIWA